MYAAGAQVFRDPPYAQITLFCGTTNDPTFLTDTTGNRRFLAIECGVVEPTGDLFADGVEEYFTQAWAEAVHIYKTERPPLVLDADLRECAQAQQERFTEEDP